MSLLKRQTGGSKPTNQQNYESSHKRPDSATKHTKHTEQMYAMVQGRESPQKGDPSTLSQYYQFLQFSGTFLCFKNNPLVVLAEIKPQ